MGANYYKTLGIDKSATEDDIKKAYKKMALKWHPDRNKGSAEANAKFKEVSEAFEVLSDGNKRATYDQFGEEGLKGGGRPPPGQGFSGFSGFPGGGGGGANTFTFTSAPGGFGGGGKGFHPTDPQKIFEQIFGGGLGGMGGFGGLGGMGGMGGMGGGPRGGPFDMDEDDDMSGFSFGGMPGAMPGSRTSPRRSQSHSSVPPEITRPLKLSLEDLYSGTTKRLKVGRRQLDGTTEDKVLEIQVSPGWKSGTKVRFPQAGNEQPMGKAQDLVFVVEEKPHAVFTRDGNDLAVRLSLSLLEALAGSADGGRLDRTVEMLDGRKLQVPVPKGIVKPGQETTIPGEGMPIRKGGVVHRKGDLIVKWDVVFPTRLTPAQKEGLRKVLA